MPAPARRGRLAALPAFLALVIAVGGILAPGSAPRAAAEDPPQTVFEDESFGGQTAPSFTMPDGSGGRSNSACLTAGVSDAGSVRACDPNDPAPDGSGRLQLTAVQGGQSGGVSSVRGIPAGKGLEVFFDAYTYGGSGADGITFFLAAADPANPQPPATLGQTGGSLGYAGPSGLPGLPNAYLGVGLDTYGNFSTAGADGSGCTGAPGALPSNVTVRGPGNGSTGYCYLLGASAGQLRSDTPIAVPVHIVVNPTAGTVVDSTGQSVPAGSGRVDWTPIDGPQRSLAGPLPTTRNGGIPAGLYPDSWIDPDTGIPWKLMYGWTGGTGGADDAHEIGALRSASLAGPVTQLQLSAGSTVKATRGTAGTVTFDTAIAGSPAGEAEPIAFTATFPSGLTPQLPSDDQRHGVWQQCAVAGQELTCQAADGSPFPLGATLPLTLPFTTGSDAPLGAAKVGAQVISADAEPDIAAAVVSVVLPTASITAVPSPTEASYGAATRFDVTGLPIGATGTVGYRLDGAADPVCSASLPTTSCGSTDALGAGTHRVVATWSGDGDWGSSDSPAAVFTIAKAGVTATVQASPATIAYGGVATLSMNGLPSGATGAVAFVDATGAVLCAATAASPSCSTAATLEPGDRRVTGTWVGDDNHDALTSSDVPFGVARIPTTLSLQPDATAPYLASRTFTIAGLPSDATGTVLVATVSGTAICTITLDATGCATAGRLPGTVQLTAAYAGDVRYAPSASAPASFTVTPLVSADPRIVPGVGSRALRLAWPAVAGAMRYRVQLARDDAPDTVLQAVDAGAATTATVAGLTASTVYAWSVVAYGPDDVQLATLAYRAVTAETADLTTDALAATGATAPLPGIASGSLLLLAGGLLLVIRRRRPLRR